MPAAASSAYRLDTDRGVNGDAVCLVMPRLAETVREDEYINNATRPEKFSDNDETSALPGTPQSYPFVAHPRERTRTNHHEDDSMIRLRQDGLRPSSACGVPDVGYGRRP